MVTRQNQTNTPMKIALIGATGGIGIELVRQAVDRGHDVTALVRAPEKLREFEDRIRIVRGDALNRNEMARTFAGHTALLSAFGPRLPLVTSDADLLTRFAPMLTDAMREATVTRLVIVSVAFLFRDAIVPPAYLFGRLFFPKIVADAAAMEKNIMAAGWTGRSCARRNLPIGP